MTIKQQGGIFGRNPTFNDVETNKLDVDNVNIDGNTISATDTNGDLTVEANGTGEVKIPSDVELNQGTKGILKLSGDSYKIEGGNNFGDIRITFPRLRFFEGANLVGQFDNDDFTVNRGNLVIGTSGKGIDFSATSGTGTSELFDDYEEGTWSPTYDDTGGTGSYTQDVSRGLYTKVGNKVTVHFEVRTDAVSGATGDVIITGLPFTPSGTDYNETGVGAVAALTIQGFTTQAPTACVAKTSGNIELLYDNGGVTTNLPAANLGTGTNSNRLRGTVTYLIT